MSTDNFHFDRHDSQSEDTYTTPISPLSPQERYPPVPTPLLTISIPSNLSDDGEEFQTANEMKTLIHSSDQFLSFPLQDSWTFWYFKNDRTCAWQDNLIELITVSTVESFWGVFIRLKKAGELEQGCDYLLFKNHIKPMWEDPYNRTGGRWCLNLNKSQRLNDLNDLWLHTLLSLIGDQYMEDSVNVNGCVVSVRNKGDRICLWTKEWRNRDVTKRIGIRFREVASIPAPFLLTFESHEDQESKRGASSKVHFRA